jgi:tRNA (adenine57-N1/adenine58-N1)-methyltransferase
MKSELVAGESILLVDRKQRAYLRRLERGRRLSVRGGTILCDDLIDRAEGRVVRSSLNEPFLVLRPTLAQLIPQLPRRAQVIYPKDIGLILVWADIYPGARVVEAGAGPGALTLALLRAVGPEGEVVSYEVREDFAEMARANVERFHGKAANWKLKVADAALHLDEREVDRILLDLPEPWSLTERAWQSLRSGGLLLSFVPTVLQVKNTVDSLRAHGGYACIETLEALLRPWHVQGLSVRPEHRMVAHTGFLTLARKIQRGE